MKQLTSKEEEVMLHFWHHGPMFVRELLTHYEEPRPHFNTLSTVVRGLVEKGYIAHRARGNSHQYYAVVEQAAYSRRTLSQIVGRYFSNSYLTVVSSLVEDDSISIEELSALLEQVKARKNEGEK